MDSTLTERSPLEANPPVTVAVCTYNRAELLKKALDSLARQDTGGEFTFDILVVDDGSVDDTAEVVAAHELRSRGILKYVRGEGQGVGAARNTAVRESRSEWIAFMDDDETADPAWLRRLYATAVQSHVLMVGGPMRLVLSDEQRARLSPLCRLVLGGFEYAVREACPFPSTESPGGGNVLLHRSVFRKAGLFDTRRSAGEDTELWARARAAGVEPWYAPGAIVWHYVPPERLEDESFHCNSMRWGASFAQDDWQKSGPAVALLACGARVAKALLIAAPRLALALLTRDERTGLEMKCALWRTEGYVRRCLSLMAPRMLAQRDFAAYVDFRMQKDVAGGLREKTGLFVRGGVLCRLGKR
ncbi:MAG: glycosyltransferase family 2 protein [Planctomycetota bacterium]|jgi:glycosyltransferase involved in cell wall biosynthesis